MIGKLLGHSQAQTRAHLDNSAVESTGSRIASGITAVAGSALHKFHAKPEVVAAVAEAARLGYGRPLYPQRRCDTLGYDLSAGERELYDATTRYRERTLHGGGEVRSRLPEINAAMEREQYRRLLPGYVRRFVETTAPLIGLRLEGDPGCVFGLAPERPRAADALLGAMETYPEEIRGRLTVRRPESGGAIWMHPGEPVFDRFRDTLLSYQGNEARRGAIFVDPHAEAPYLFHLA